MAQREGTRAGWSTKKKDTSPRGVSRHASGVWAIRFVCGAGCMHKERVGPIKQDAIRTYHDRRKRAHDEPGWCPAVEREQARADARAVQARRMTFRQYAEQDYQPWAKLHHRGWRTEGSRITAMVAVLGDLMLDAITAAEVERFLDGLLKDRAPSTRNRYRTLLHAMLNRAKRHGRLTDNPVAGVGKFREPEGRVLHLTLNEEAVVRAALAPDAMLTGRATLDARRPDLRPLFTISVHTGLRWSEQRALRWGDADFFTGLITVRHSKTGYSRQVPMNSLVRSELMDLAGQRERPADPQELVFRCRYQQPDKFFPAAVARARAALAKAGKDVARLEGYTWHCNRHTFASRLVMAGVDLRSVQQLGGWRTLTMVQRYSHLAPQHLRDAVERLVGPVPEVELARN
jgi:integrase